MNALSAAQEANSRGLAALRAADPAAAIAAFTEASGLDPQAGPLWRNLAHAHRLAGDDAGERAALERALKLDRTDFTAQLRLAQLLQRTGAEVAALQAWDGVFQLAAQLPHAPSGELAIELDAGRTYSGALRDRLGMAAERALAPERATYTEKEARRLEAFVGLALGTRRVYHNECAGAHYPFLPEDEFFDRDLFPSFDELEAAAPEIREELEGLLASGEEILRPYVKLDEGTPLNHWSPLDGSLDWGACFLWEYGVANQPVLERCPRTAAVLERLPLARIPGRAPNAFFSLLKPGKRIPPHTGVTNTRAIVHLALDVPPGCGFRVGNEVREWVEGRAFAFDDTIEHEAWNTSDRRRAVLILDYWNPHLTAAECAAIVRYFAAADAALSR
jgi:aspartate beta-hydroxylase